MTQFAPQPNGLINFAALRSQVSIAQVLELTNWHATTQNGDQLRGPCPIHKSSSEQSRSLSVSLAKNAFQCFGCGAKGNQLDLAKAMFGVELYEAARELCDRLGIEPPMREG